MPGAIQVFGKLPTYPSPKSTFCPEREVSVNVGSGEGWKGSFPETLIDPDANWVSGKLLTYPCPKSTFCPERVVSVNVGSGEGWMGSFPETLIDPYAILRNFFHFVAF